MQFVFYRADGKFAGGSNPGHVWRGIVEAVPNNHLDQIRVVILYRLGSFCNFHHRSTTSWTDACLPRIQSLQVATSPPSHFHSPVPLLDVGGRRSSSSSLWTQSYRPAAKEVHTMSFIPSFEQQKDFMTTLFHEKDLRVYTLINVRRVVFESCAWNGVWFSLLPIAQNLQNIIKQQQLKFLLQ